MTRRHLAHAACLAIAVLAGAGCAPLIVGGVATTGVLIADDRRTTGSVVDDQSIELRLGGRLTEEFGKGANINVTAYNRIVLLTGEVPTDEVRAAAGKAAAGHPNGVFCATPDELVRLAEAPVADVVQESAP